MERKWWHEKVAYQIYPKSFYDSNGDGIGDIPGIIDKLDYLKDLGVDIVWISPCYPSPFADQGYDISDYYNINPVFGTLEDMDRLLAEAKKRDMYILLDLVVNHCSDEHEWFKKACEDPDGKYGNFFYITDKKEGELPCNWRSYFGGPVWETLPGNPDKQYLHVFHRKQPDLNWENPEVREEIYKNINWWLDRGVSGFRIDAIINIKKKIPFADYPVDRPDGLSSIQNMLKEATGIGEFLSEMQARTFGPHNAFSVGEVFDEKDEELPDFIGDGGYFSSMFDFSTTIFGGSPNGWYDRKTITPDDYKECCFHSQQRVGDIGYLSNIIEHHDEPRGVSHYIPDGDLSLHSKKLLATMYFMLTGIRPDESVKRLIRDQVVPLWRFKNIGLERYKEQVIMKGMAVDAKKRYSSMDDLCAALYSNGKSTGKWVKYGGIVCLLAAGAATAIAQCSSFEKEDTTTEKSPSARVITTPKPVNKTYAPSPIPTRQTYKMCNVIGLKQSKAIKKLHTLNANLKIKVRWKISSKKIKER